MCQLRYRLKMFLVFGKVMFRYQDIEIFVFLTIPWFIKSVTSWWVLGHETVHFWIYLLKHKSLTHQTLAADRYMQGQQISGIFWTIWWLGINFRSFSTCSNYSITDYLKIPVFYFFKKVKGTFKIGKYQLLKMATSGYVFILIKL